MAERAVVLAAGRGTRMGEITSDLPKPMLRVHGRPLLEHVLDRLAEAGVREFLVIVGYRRELIEEYFHRWRLPVHFREQKVVNGTGSAALLARDFAVHAPFLLTFGDILCEPDAYVQCGRVLDDHPDTVAVLGVKAVDDPWRGAAVYIENERITRVVEKPPRGTSKTRWNSAGLFGLRPLVFQYLDRLQPTARGEYELTSAFEMMLADSLELRICEMQGNWRDVGTPEDLQAANSDS
jgi:NDP-sugar pyrophosphorylase family protein